MLNPSETLLLRWVRSRTSGWRAGLGWPVLGLGSGCCAVVEGSLYGVS